MRLALALLLSTVATTAPSAARAAEADVGDTSIIIVTAKPNGYALTTAPASVKTDTPALDVPQSLSVVPAARILDQGQRALTDVLRYVPGVSLGQGEGNRDQISIRGQNTTADFFLDGVRDDTQYFRPTYNLARVEVLRGANALLFGRGGGGGVINRVTVVPTLGETSGVAGAGVTTLGNVDLNAGVNLPVSGRIAVRADGFYEHLANHRDRYGGDRFAINPQVLAEIAPGWRALLSYEHLDDRRSVDRGNPSVVTAPGQPNTPLRGYDNRLFGIPGFNRASVVANIATARLDGELGGGIEWSTTARFADYSKYYANVYPNGAVTAAGTVPLAAYDNGTQRQNLIVQSNLTAKPRTGPFVHTLLAGAEYGHQGSASDRTNGVVTPAAIPLAGGYPSVLLNALVTDQRSGVEFVSLYVQDQVAVARWLDLVAGVRWDRFAIRGTDFVPNPDRPFARTDTKVSPRFGVILKPTGKLSVYGSYTRSFLPRAGDQFLGLTLVQANLAPEAFTNYEVGAKWQPTPALLATAAVFQLDRANATTPDPFNPLVTINVGATRTQGVEAELTGRILPGLNLSAGYSYTDARLRGNEAVRLAQTPRHRVTLWSRYDVTSRVGLGFGLVHQSSQFAAIRTVPSVTLLPAFTRLDAALFYKLTERTQVQVNIENLADARFFPDAHNANNISTAPPLNARLAIRTRF